jgi:formimidoylglutamate deiminase
VTNLLHAPQAWVQGRWRESVLLEVDHRGHWRAVLPETPPPAQAQRLNGPVLPGLVNAHSHAFQRAFAGLAERRTSEHDDFWSWRDRMYGVALTMEPGALRQLATRLYRELLAGGYTQVCEFHYLHHQRSGERYAEPAAMSQALIAAAADAGIGLTLLPVLYERAGFRAPGLREDQRRFRSDLAFVQELRAAVSGPLNHAGVAVHSLRAATPASMHALVDAMAGAGPIHIHIAEQTAEVEECLAATGQRPIAWLANHVALDARWQLVHATHAEPAEIEAVAASGAGVVLCPSTEANLGDGVPDLPRWLGAGVPLSIGSDSQVGRHAAHELRWLEYAQRLVLRRRNVAADAQRHEGATAARLFERCLHGGAAAAGWACAGLTAGARADLLVLDAGAPGLDTAPPSHALDAWVFACDSAGVAETWVAGRRVA